MIEKTFYPVCGKHSKDRSVSVYHTNKNYLNFDFMIQTDVDKMFEQNDIVPGTYLLNYGYQNGYNEIGYMVIHVT